MDSLELYESHRKKYVNEESKGDLLLAGSEIAKLICFELKKEPFEINSSPFVQKVNDILNEIKANPSMHWIDKPIFALDAHLILRVASKMLNGTLAMASMDSEYAKYILDLFKNPSFNETQLSYLNEEIGRNLKEISHSLMKMQLRAANKQHKGVTSYTKNMTFQAETPTNTLQEVNPPGYISQISKSYSNQMNTLNPGEKSPTLPINQQFSH